MDTRDDLAKPKYRARRGLFAALAAFLLVLSACGGNSGGSDAAEDTTGGDSSDDSGGADADLPLFYGVFATSLEEPWDGAIHAALSSAAEDGMIEYRHLDGLGTADAMERSLREIATEDKPAVIVGDAFAAEDAVRAVAADFPEIQFAFGSGGGPVAPNFSVFDNWMQDPGYLAGMLAGGTTESNTIGVVGAMPIPEVNRIINGFIEGVAETNPDATVLVSFINSFFDPATAQQAAQAQIDAGADVLFAERDGVIAAAAEAEIPAIGMMVDQSDQAPDFVATSLLWFMRPTIDHLIENVASDTVTSEDLAQFSFLVNGGSAIAPINTDLIDGDLIAKIAERQAEMESGSFETTVNEETPAGSTDVTG